MDHVSDQFIQICDDRNEINMEFYKIFTRKWRDALLITHVVLFGIIWYVSTGLDGVC